ncbi:hypothetical protein ACX0AN_003726 [Acinetobacter baumannii]|uniref:Uncharacterized protein n=2 Tax=Acinetobacter baumannii TaxID=470 RepID=A0AAP1R0H4_ACIBA|nr:MULTISPECIES: hypothetical protein [Acinetobacter calcoaceticus/baumannii complex]EHU1539775.1 hypothetical protein [Acinetobacter baumannii]EHU3345233.1 hypothetical protein [Acinetobacter baumannii]EJB8481939.1 hypothetical protein [Acinetobacter baumannii]EKT8317612.1 hypothetical protein [Acinetobacter baumannii]EKU0057937.1 hypothetical protein [Acinetobacter baumannii]
MQVADCSVVTQIEGVNYCIVVLHQTSWMDELNNLPPEQVIALLSATILIWYLASGLRTTLYVLGSSTKEE